MGLNISGLVIDKDYSDDLTELGAIIGKTLIFEKEIMFEDALESWKEDTYCDVYFSPKGTFVLLCMTRGGFDFYAKNQTAFSFVLSESTMMFTINYVKNGELLRSIMETTEEGIESEGEPFDFEKDNDDNSELIFHLIEKTLGESFEDIIDAEAKCLRYSYQSDEKSAQEVTPKEQSVEQTVSKPAPDFAAPRKPWWRFWPIAIIVYILWRLGFNSLF